MVATKNRAYPEYTIEMLYAFLRGEHLHLLDQSQHRLPPLGELIVRQRGAQPQPVQRPQAVDLHQRARDAALDRPPLPEPVALIQERRAPGDGRSPASPGIASCGQAFTPRAGA
jgi:hypothetical protein